MTCTITRARERALSRQHLHRKLHRRIETLIEYLTRANRVPTGTVLLTGTGIIVPREAALAPGDVVTISVPEIGDLTNPVMTVS